eukprot:TRINITY_DN1632_c0_g1_i2.p1 TRINITY_DN1632_c0_g1~~TRINITY_DN1632_c0_g1_i2.p1  ORF type:complete len:297 (-),score=31.48 TRINITY_DN1632_c0_g1_i2:369-1259(-)
MALSRSRLAVLGTGMLTVVLLCLYFFAFHDDVCSGADDYSGDDLKGPNFVPWTVDSAGHWSELCAPFAPLSMDSVKCSNGTRHDVDALVKAGHDHNRDRVVPEHVHGRHAPDDRLCYNSVLDVLLSNVYDVLENTGATPLLAYGTTLGGYRNRTIMPWTPDIDIFYLEGKGYVAPKWNCVRRELEKRNITMFNWNHQYRICVARSHPLAKVLPLQDPSLTSRNTVPYLDFYSVTPEPPTARRKTSSVWRMMSFKGHSLAESQVCAQPLIRGVYSILENHHTMPSSELFAFAHHCID